MKMRNNLKLQSNNKLAVLEKEFIWKIIFSSYFRFLENKKTWKLGKALYFEKKWTNEWMDERKEKKPPEGFYISCSLLFLGFLPWKLWKLCFLILIFCLHLFIKNCLLDNVYCKTTFSFLYFHSFSDSGLNYIKRLYFPFYFEDIKIITILVFYFYT